MSKVFLSLGFVVCVLSGTSLAQEQTVNLPKYAIKQADPDLGTNIRRNAIYGSVIPFDKTYAELTEVQKEALRSQYVHMGDADEPPFPVNGLGPVFKGMQKAQQKLLVSGRLDIVLNIDSNGEATDVQVFKSPDPDMAKVVAALLMTQKYKPALCSGVPCKMGFPFLIEFKVRK